MTNYVQITKVCCKCVFLLRAKGHAHRMAGDLFLLLFLPIEACVVCLRAMRCDAVACLARSNAVTIKVRSGVLFLCDVCRACFFVFFVVLVSWCCCTCALRSFVVLLWCFSRRVLSSLAGGHFVLAVVASAPFSDDVQLESLLCPITRTCRFEEDGSDIRTRRASYRGSVHDMNGFTAGRGFLM